MSEIHSDHETIDEQPGGPDVAATISQDTRPGSRSLLPIAIAVSLFAGALIVTFILIRSGGNDDATLDATKMTLELSYPVGASATANLNGQAGAAPAGAPITCRVASSKQRIGQGEAGDDGSFDITLDAATWPLESLSRDGYTQLNKTLECRAGSGDWVTPLRQPRVKIN
jgi:hypothetical protein